MRGDADVVVANANAVLVHVLAPDRVVVRREQNARALQTKRRGDFWKRRVVADLNSEADSARVKDRQLVALEEFHLSGVIAGQQDFGVRSGDFSAVEHD